MSWSTALDEIRDLLSDGATDKLRARKRCIGPCNGANTVFKTFEFRRISDFTSPSFPLGVFITDAASPSTAALDDPSTGTFTLSSPPGPNDFVEATYYIQYFIDDELNKFLINASRWLTSSDDFTQVPPGLQPSALKYAASDAYQKLSIRWMDHMSETYRLEDKPDEKNSPIVDSFQKKAEYFKKSATEARDEYYTRQGQSLSPNFISIAGSVRDIPPRS